MLRLYLKKADSGGEVPPLSDYRLRKLEKLRDPTLRAQMITAEALLNRAVRELDPTVGLPLEIAAGEKGKPYLVRQPWHFSLSHSDEYVACAVADHVIGLDLQRIREGSDALLRRCFSERERQAVRESAGPEEAFTRLWTVKESYVKATGEGLSVDFSMLSLDPAEPPQLMADPRARFWTMTRGAYCLCLCALNEEEAIPDTIIEES